MKLDVSYTDHSHIIGKGGMTIKKVMEETGCHIHFPDSNRSNMNEKSNQVSIAGELDGVEKARARVRVGPYLIKMCWIKPAKCVWLEKAAAIYHETVNSEASFLGLWNQSPFWCVLCLRWSVTKDDFFIFPAFKYLTQGKNYPSTHF